MGNPVNLSNEERVRRGERIRAACTLEDKKKGGKVQGQRHAENKTGVCGRSPEQRILDGQKGGLVSGPIAAKHPNSKRALAALLQDRDHQRYAAHCSNHTRRNFFKQGCEWCETEALEGNNARQT